MGTKADTSRVVDMRVAKSQQKCSVSLASPLRHHPVAFQNILIRAKLSEYHTGYRAFSREVLEKLNLTGNSDDFVFDNQILAQAAMFGFWFVRVPKSGGGRIEFTVKTVAPHAVSQIDVPRVAFCE